MARVLGDGVTLVLVNLSNDAVTTTMILDRGLLDHHAGQFQVIDAWQDDWVAHESGYAWSADDLASFELPCTPYGVHVLPLRPAN